MAIQQCPFVKVGDRAAVDEAVNDTEQAIVKLDPALGVNATQVKGQQQGKPDQDGLQTLTKKKKKKKKNPGSPWAYFLDPVNVPESNMPPHYLSFWKPLGQP
eukprot:646239-Amphidinium_carterae.1